MPDDVIYTARVIRTANPAAPTAQAIAVRDGRVLSVGSLEDCRSWGITNIDNRFADKVLTAGFVEAHAHVLVGMFAAFPYVGRFARKMHDGSVAPAIESPGALIARLREVDATMEPGASLIAAGYDPIYFEGERLNRHHLDEVSDTRPVVIFHASGHLMTVNSVALAKYGIDATTPTPGVGIGADGTPDGEMREMAAMGLIREEFIHIGRVISGEEGFAAFGAFMRNAGITTSTDLSNDWLRNPDLLRTRTEAAARDSFPVRVVSASRVSANIGTMEEVAALIKAQQTPVGSKTWFPVVKLVLDGSIQGFTAVMDWPGYHTGEDHALFLIPPEQTVDALRPFHVSHIGIHCHCNGNIAADVFIDAIETLQGEHSWPDARHTITHAQTMSTAQMKKARNLGMQANFFVNHVWFWGDQHRSITLGPDRADHMNPCGTADRIGLGYSFHSDAPVTPPGHLHTMWAAVNRVTPSGRVLGDSERISVDRAFHAATIDAAYQLHMDRHIGSLETGKFADMTVLDEDPYEVDPMHIRDINVWGTIVGGVIHRNP